MLHAGSAIVSASENDVLRIERLLLPLGLALWSNTSEPEALTSKQTQGEPVSNNNMAKF